MEKLNYDQIVEKSLVTTPNPIEERRAIRVQHILKFISENQGTTAYAISKKLKYSYSDVCRIIRDLIYTSVIVSQVEVENSIVRKKLFIPQEEKK